MRLFLLSFLILGFISSAQAEDAFSKNYGQLENVKWLTAIPTSKTKMRLVVFWATWCGPCVSEIGRLNDIQNKYGKQLDVIGLNVETLNGRERAADADEKINEYIKKQIRYSVAVDQDNFNEKNWLNELSVSHIPHALLIDAKGNLVWSDHPAVLDDELIEKLLAKNYVGSKEHTDSIAKQRESAEATNRFTQMMKDANTLFKAGKWNELVDLVTEAEKHAKFSLLPNYKAHALLNELDRADDAYDYAFQVANQDDEMAWYRLLNMLQEVFYSTTPPPKEVREGQLMKLVHIVLEKISKAEFHSEWVRPVHAAMVFKMLGDIQRTELSLMHAYGLASEDERPSAIHTIKNMGYMVVCEQESCKLVAIKKSCNEQLTETH